MTPLIRLTSIIILSHSLVYSQENDSIIYIKNKSFEGLPNYSSVPEGWMAFGFRNTPDTQPAPQGVEPFFGVTNAAYNGNTYLGMVVRQNETYERVVQKLEGTLKKRKCYSFSIYLARSNKYASPIALDLNNALALSSITPFTTPVILRIWGGNSEYELLEHLYESKIVNETEWTKYEFKFKPKNDLKYLTLEAYYDPDKSTPYNGNILLDNASDIRLIPCKKNKRKWHF